MPMISPKRQVSDAENKLRLLFCVDALGFVTETQLWPFVASLNLMEYMPMQLLLHELMAGGFVGRGTHALEGQLFVSAEGKSALGQLGHRVMPQDQKRITDAAPAYRAQLIQQAHVRATYETARPGAYRVLLELREEALPILTLRLSTASRDLAAQAMHSFEANAASILTCLYRLGEDSDPEPALPPAAALQSHGPHEHVVTTELVTGDLVFEVSLLLSSLSGAAAYSHALARPETAQKTAEHLALALCGLPPSVPPDSIP